ncbi:MAG: protein translocase subunit SecF [Candidatus Limnocylindrus sp. ZSMar2m-chloro-G89]|nr:MAG: protein translocase subunit SecF [Candidatus Limnocylindrus sp. ZSMar2m-chloro-G89]
MNKIIARKRWFFLFSLLVTIPGLFFIIATPLSGGAIGLKFSVDYTGGTVWEFKLEQPADALVVRDVVAAAGHPEVQVTEAGSGFLIMRTKPLDLQSGSESDPSQPAGAELAAIRAAIESEVGPIAEAGSLSTVGPVISQDLTQQAILLIALGSIGIVLWMTYRFRNLRFGLAALVALLHDVIVTVGFFAVAGTLFGVEIDALFITAMLTIIGFSVHDTIVVFDRVRENLARYAGAPFADIVNHSIVQTLGRSFNTTATVLITLLSLLVFAGGSIRTFVLALFVGILSGTYSSIFNASPLLVWWDERVTARKSSPSARRTA